jgi:hypothetical protein
MRLILIVISMVLMTTNQASAGGKYYIGSGAKSCGAWIEARRTRGAQVALCETWVLGYLSGANLGQDGKDFLGRVLINSRCLLSGVKRKCAKGTGMSPFDPKTT